MQINRLSKTAAVYVYCYLVFTFCFKTDYNFCLAGHHNTRHHHHHRHHHNHRQKDMVLPKFNNTDFRSNVDDDNNNNYIYDAALIDNNEDRPQGDQPGRDASQRPAATDDSQASSSSSSLLDKSNCTSCLFREEAKLARIDRIKEDLLQKLGFREPPNASERDLALYASHIEGMLQRWGFNSGSLLNDEPENLPVRYETDNFNAQTEKVFAFASKPPVFLGLPDNQPIAYFKFSNETTNNFVENVTLRYYINKGATFNRDEPVSQLVARLYKIDRRDGTKTEIAQKPFKRDMRLDGLWEEFRGANITRLVRHWFKKPELNYGLSLEVSYNGENLVALPGTNQPEKYTMHMEVQVRENEQSRRKRETPQMDCKEESNEPRCCRYALQIDFDKFGWDWVIAPKKYIAYYCSGECPFRHLQRYMHTHIVQQQANARANMGPCCYPTSMGSITMVYFNTNKEVHVARVPGMVVNRCGCA